MIARAAAGASIVGAVMAVAPAAGTLAQPRLEVELPPQVRADVLRAVIALEDDHLAGVPADRPGFEREDACVLGAEWLRCHGSILPCDDDEGRLH